MGTCKTRPIPEPTSTWNPIVLANNVPTSSVYKQTTPAVMIRGPVISHTPQWTFGIDVLETMVKMDTPRMSGMVRYPLSAAETLNPTSNPTVAGRDHTPNLTPQLHSQQETSRRPHNHHQTQQIQLKELLPESHPLRRGRRSRRLQHQRDQPRRKRTQRQIHPKTPPPRQVLGKHATQQRPQDTRTTKRDPQHRHTRGRPLGRRHQRNDGKRARDDARPPHAADGAARDERGAGGGGAGQRVAGFEDEDRGEEGELQVEVAEGFAPGGLEGGGGQEEGAAVPGDVVEAVEGGGDGRDGVGEDGEVDGEEEDAEDEGGEEGEEFGGGEGGG
ncbi:hypothetical protein CHGG_05014 [Chaetomium globosum CBS 148.51]|uniref:Uncharacterized protein n=1 Tax=Chaetomium globosum (strain ATCC 6205 / CBS 148.51 / DSM 1962 / NBRC 6347 / NRRL 1970) TaxID=306901 RepID=Q2GZN2_CHAGB|nr:uncharacterized protein CHGG_05014 [Chaetomium globosum CBS 148.51]EAQ88395.1 hypothetical protein CHGG_05014 [Chaetomium globosum CBS 148.51]